MTTAYLDNQASTPLDPSVRRVLLEAFAHPGNASAEQNAFGWRAAERLEAARRDIAQALRASPEGVIFTSGASESNNIAILGFAEAAPPERRKILVSAVEHKSVLEAAHAAERSGFEVVRIPVTAAGMVEPDRLAALVDENTAVVSVMAVNNEIGVIQPARELARIAHDVGAVFHVDATQALGAIDVHVVDWGVDSLSLSAHKIYGPQGIGLLYVAQDVLWRPRPRAFGGGQEGGLRPGTVPVALAVALAEACRLAVERGKADREEARRLRARLLSGLRSVFETVEVTAEVAPRHPGCLHVRLPGYDASDLLMRIQPDVAASTGSACTSGVIGPSHVLKAIGLNDQEASECLRFSIGRFTTEAEVEAAITVIRSAALRAAA